MSKGIENSCALADVLMNLGEAGFIVATFRRNRYKPRQEAISRGKTFAETLRNLADAIESVQGVTNDRRGEPTAELTKGR